MFIYTNMVLNEDGNLCLSVKVVLCKFHSVFLSQKGQVYTCGHGQGGRLGHGDEQTYLVRHFGVVLTHVFLHLLSF